MWWRDGYRLEFYAVTVSGRKVCARPPVALGRHFCCSVIHARIQGLSAGASRSSTRGYPEKKRVSKRVSSLRFRRKA